MAKFIPAPRPPARRPPCCRPPTRSTLAPSCQACNYASTSYSAGCGGAS